MIKTFNRLIKKDGAKVMLLGFALLWLGGFMLGGGFHVVFPVCAWISAALTFVIGCIMLDS